MRPISAWLIGLLNIAVAAFFAFILLGDWREFLHGDYARAYSGSCLLDVVTLLGAVGTCAYLIFRYGDGPLFQRAVAWGLLLRYVWEYFLDNIRLGTVFPDLNDWDGISIWGTIIILALYSSRVLRRIRPDTL